MFCARLFVILQKTKLYMEQYKIDTVEKYNEFHGFKTHNPLVAVIEGGNHEQVREYTVQWGLYTLFLKNTKSCNISYGRTEYDYDDQTVVCMAPGQVAHIEIIEGVAPSYVGLVFHPDLLLGTSLADKMSRYGFFSYFSNEALHLSESERAIVYDCLMRIKHETENPEDEYSKELIVSNIEVLLDYCLRFYSRQFATREKLNRNVIFRFEGLLDNYINGPMLSSNGFPSVKYFANEMRLSANYFGDLVKKETGKTAQEFIQLKFVNVAKNKLLDMSLNISQVAYSLGFQYPQHFVRFFKREVGCTPREFRLQLSRA